MLGKGKKHIFLIVSQARGTIQEKNDFFHLGLDPPSKCGLFENIFLILFPPHSKTPLRSQNFEPKKLILMPVPTVLTIFKKPNFQKLKTKNCGLWGQLPPLLEKVILSFFLWSLPLRYPQPPGKRFEVSSAQNPQPRKNAAF